MTDIKVTHRNRAFPLECWQYTGQSFDQWPDWLQSKFPFTPKPRPVKGTWALRDDEGDFYRWLDIDTFALRYEAIDATPMGVVVAWSYELACARNWVDGKPAEYSDWQPYVTVRKPNVPPGSIRNLRPLYAGPVESIT